MTGFEPGSSAIGSDRSANYATITALILFIFLFSVRHLYSPIGPSSEGKMGHLDLHGRRPEVLHRRRQRQVHHPVDEVSLS